MSICEDDHIDHLKEMQEMIASACAYDNIDPKLQIIVVEKHQRILENTISAAKNNINHSISTETYNHFDIFLNKIGIKQAVIFSKQVKVPDGFLAVKDPRFGWGPNNIRHYLLIPQELALKAKVLGYLA